MKKLKVSVIIPNFNGKDLLKDCLSSLEKQSFRNFEIILVDNNSQDSSIEYIGKNFPDTRIIKLEKNYGFAKAINEGVKFSFAKYVVFLNNDTKLNRDYLKNLVKCADSHPKVISVNPKILNFKNPKRLDGVGILINEVGQARSIGYNEKDIDQYNKHQYIFGATGGASLFKRKEFIKVGYFNEDFFMYSEEVDFAFRSQFLGYKSIYCPKAVVFHKHKATAKRYPNHIEYWQFRNMTQTIILDFPLKILLKRFRWLKIILVHFNTIFYQIKNRYFWPPFAADLWILLNLPKLLIKRKKIQSAKRVKYEYIEMFLTEKRITLWGLLK